MTSTPFAPKDADTIKSEVLLDLGIDYEGNEDLVDKIVARGLKDEEFKASLHADKVKHLEDKGKLKERLTKAGLDPETGEKLGGNPSAEVKSTTLEQILESRALNDVHEDDVEEIALLAKERKISLREARKNPYIQAYLKTREEERKSAQVANTQTNKRSTKIADDKIADKFYTNEDLSEEDKAKAMQALFAKKKAALNK